MEDTQKIVLNSDRYLNKISRIFYILTVIVISFTGYMNQDGIYEILKLNLLSIILVSITIFYAKSVQIKLEDNLSNSIMLISGYTFSLICIMLSVKFNIYNLWLIGPMMIAMLFDTNLGLSFHLLFSFMISVTSGFTMDILIFNFILGALGCLLSKYIIDLSKVGYTLIIFLSSNITLIYIINNFMTKEALNVNVLYSVLSSIIAVATTYIAYLVYRRINGSIKAIDVHNEVGKQESTIINGTEKDGQIIYNNNPTLKLKEQSIFDVFTKDDYELVIKLKEFSEKLYNRSRYTSEVSYEATIRIHGNANLAKTGGFYCKIGRIISKNYIEEGVKLLEEHNFPPEVIQIVKQHNIKNETPKSAEAAIVMLVDSIIASTEAVKSMKESKPIPMNKLIDGIFTLRFTKSTLEESGLSSTNLNELKAFFIEELPNISKKYEM